MPQLEEPGAFLFTAPSSTQREAATSKMLLRGPLWNAGIFLAPVFGVGQGGVALKLRGGCFLEAGRVEGTLSFLRYW